MTQKTNRTVKEAKGIAIGDSVSNFNAKDIHDSMYSLIESLKTGPVLVIFIRGQWCPFCNKHLSAIQQSLPQIYAKGASVIVISPEKSEFIKKSIEKTGAEFTILYDENYKIADAFDVTFKPDRISRFMYNTMLGANLKETHSDDSERLPVPATYIIGRDGKVVWRHFDPNYKKRSTVVDIIKNIPTY